MKHIALVALAVALALVASCGEKPTTDIKFELDGKTYVAPAWRLVEKDGKLVLTATVPGKGVVAVPITEGTTILLDGKPASADTLRLPGGGSCPCKLPQCLPYCRPIGDVLSPPQP